ncbi:MAG: hypothetical protein PUF35_09750 [Subdoligranulum sp.]|nr:hypothetical protein [Subdoligranulum sp.]
MLDKTSSIIFAFGLAAAAPRSPYRHLELCGVALFLFGNTICVNVILSQYRVFQAKRQTHLNFYQTIVIYL